MEVEEETEAGTVTSDDCCIATGQSDEQLQCLLDAVQIHHRNFDDVSSDRILTGSAYTYSCTNDVTKLGETGECGPACDANDRDTKIQCVSCHINHDSSYTSAGVQDADLMSSVSNIAVKDAETERCFIHFDAAKDDSSTDWSAAQHVQLAHETDESVTVVHCCQSQQLLKAEYHECNEDIRHLDDTSCSDKDVGQCFTVSTKSQTRCTPNSLQDAFMQFLKRKQVIQIK